MSTGPDYVNPGFTEPDDAPPIPDDCGPEEIGPLLAEVLDLADQAVAKRYTDEELERRLRQVKALAKPKRKVSYNQDVILCPDCKKRIRLNNDGRVRKHLKGKSGSYECPGSYASPAIKDFVSGSWASSETKPKNSLFSDAQ